MSENETKSADAGASESAPADDRFKNFQAEINRKLQNQNEQLQSLLSELKSKPATQTTGTETKKISVFDDEEAYSRQIEERATARIKAELAQQQSQASRHQQVVQQIMVDYPETNDESSDLMVRAKEVYAGYSSEDKQSPLAMKAAVTMAAAELGLKPKSKRVSRDSDSFTVSSGSRPATNTNRNADLDARTEMFAQIMGLDTKKKEVRENLKSKAKKDYTRYSE